MKYPEVSTESYQEKSGEVGEPDMISLLTLNEQTILENLQLRYEAGQIYTYTGSILVALNPYTMFNIYGLDIVKSYDSQPLAANPPHLFAIGSGAYSQMLKDTANQVIVISGESGAGKTESTKLIMQYLAAVNKSHDSTISDRILEANPLLESFGNAKTTRNDNSSRFGKYVEVYFKGASIVGAKTSEYLLEKSRIVSQTKEERNYHVFYEMLSGLTERERQNYGLKSAQHYHYLNQGGEYEIHSKDDLHDFLSLRSAMDVLGFKVREQTTIFRILAAVLHLGNMTFKNCQNDYQNGGVTITSETELSWVCRLLELSHQWLKVSLTCKVTEARRERMFSPLTTEQAQGSRDAVAKALYQSLFTWLVRRTNQVVNYRTEHRNKARTTSIAILDIFGFEDLKVNTFEQLCINYANETLQFYFNCHVFKLEQQEYGKEGVSWTNIQYTDNQPTIDLIAKKPNGILHILDDESHIPKGTDYSFLDKCHFEHSSHPSYDKPRMSGPEFYIRHYAGTVKYNVKQVCEKNKDTLRGDVIQLLIQSKNSVISQMFRELRDNSVTKTISKTTGFYVTAKPKTPTVAASFNESLINLIDTMSRCQPWFVRCVKPNNEKAPLLFSRPVVLSQLRYTGMLETIRIRKAGYPIRHSLNDFVERYGLLVRSRLSLHNPDKERVLCERILSTQGYRWRAAWQIGITKVFLKESLSTYLDTQVTEVLRMSVVDIQRAVRGFVCRSQLSVLRQAAVCVQAGVRGWIARRQYTKMLTGFIQLQAQYRMLRQRRRYLKERMARSLGRRNDVSASVHHGQTDRDVSRIEIPAELAYVYSKLDGWDPPHTERHLITAAGHVTTDNDTPPRLPDDINAYAFNKFVSVYFNKDTSMFVRKEPIKSAFLPKSSNYDNKEAVAVFKLILRFMNDTKMSAKQEQTLGAYVVQKALSNLSLRDEVYVQLCNQLYMNPDEMASQQGWLLMAACLSGFPPTETLAKYLLKFVSDQGYDGYKAFCQHKLLQCLHLAPQCARVYPASMLEWKASRKKAGLAVEAEFSDSEKVQGQVESWTTAEEFTANLLKHRNIEEDTFGWTVGLREDGDFYEASGHDYVLDLIGEMEVPPSFPHSKAYTLVSSDRREMGRREQYRDGPHHPDNPRIMPLEVEELRVPVPMEPRPPLKPEAFFHYASLPSESISGESWYQTRDEMLSSSRLNQRPERNVPILKDLSQSKLNMRYSAKKPAPPPPGMIDRELTNQRAPRGSSQEYNGARSPRVTSPVDETKVRVLPSKPPTNMALKRSRSPEYGQRSGFSPPTSPLTITDIPEAERNESSNRYSKHITVDPSRIPVGPPKGRMDHIPNGYVPNGTLPYNGNISPRYQGNGAVTKGNRHRAESPTRSDTNGLTDGNASEIEQWLDRVFDPVLDGNLDAQSDAQSLSNRIKGRKRIKPKKQDKETRDLEQWLEGVFSSVLEGGWGEGFLGEGVGEIGEVGKGTSPAETLERRLKGGGETVRQAQPNPPDVTGTMVTSLPLAQYSAVTAPLYGNSPGIPQPPTLLAPPPASRVQLAPIPQVSILPDYTTQIAQQQAMQMEAQQQASLQARLTTQHLENQYLQHRLQAEILKQQLHQIEGDQGVKAPVRSPPPAARPQRQASPIKPLIIPVHQPPSARSSGTFSSEEELDLSHGEVDQTRPGGVKTLLRGYENKTTKAPVTPELYNPPKNQAVIANRDLQKRAVSPVTSPRQSSVKFSETVEQIPPRKESMSPRAASPTNTKPPSPPPPPPPPPVAQSKEDDKKERTTTQGQGESDSTPPPLAVSEVIVKETKRQGIGKVVRIGRVTWPPPQDEVEKEHIEPGKLEITENQRRDAEKLTGQFNAQQRVQAMIDASKAANQKPEPAKKGLKTWNQDDLVEIDMKSRQQELQQQLSAIHRKNEDHTQTAVEKQSTGTETVVQTETQTDDKAPVKTSEVQTEEGYLDPQHKASQYSGKPVHVIPRGMRRDVQTQTQPVGDSSVAPPPAPPPPPPPPPQMFQDAEVDTSSEGTTVPPIDLPSSEDEIEQPVDLRALEKAKTRLYPLVQGPYYTYVRVPWKLEIRKEVFTPTERLEVPALVDLIFAQIVQDVYSDVCLRIGKDDKLRMKGMLESQGVTPRTVLNSGHKMALKKQVIDIAKEWPFYFCRLFAVNGGRAYPGVHYTGISHAGLSFIARETDFYDDQLKLLESVRFEDIVDVSVPKPETLQLHLSSDRYIMMYTPQAERMRTMIEAYCIEIEKEQMYVKAVKDYHTRDSTLLNFRAGDVIKLTNKDMMLDRGWLYGSLQGRAGMFPEEYVIPQPRHEVTRPPEVKVPEKEEDRVSVVSVVTTTQDGLSGKYPMLEFAMLYFRDSPYKYEMVRGPDGSIHGTFRRVSTMKALSHGDKAVTKEEWQQQLDMIRWTSSPIQASLLRFESEHNKEALENFVGLMRFMGDYPMENGMSLTGLIDHMLLTCKNHPELRDEIYCQLAKQTCDNKSTKKNSNAHGWRLLSILTAFFDCSDQLKPYLIKYLEENAYDTSKEYHLIAEQCLQNLRHTLKYGGRKNTPDKEELLALKNGRTIKHISCLLSGGVAVIITVKSCTVVSECIDQVCNELDIQSDLEKQEYTLFWVVEGEHRFCPLANDDYIIDVTTELNRMKSQYYLLFQRTSWVFPLHLGSNSLYVDCMYHQIRPEYDEGNFFYVPDGKLLNYKKDEIAVITAFLYIINQKNGKGTPQQKDVKELLPKMLEKMTDMGTSKWTSQVSERLAAMATMSPEEAKARFLDILTRWPFFGSTFFNIKGAKGPGVSCEEALLAINRQGVHILERKTHKALQTYLYEHLLTSRRHTDEKGRIYLDLKHGDLRTHEITTLETDHATAINTLISQYFKIVRSYKTEVEDAGIPKRQNPVMPTNEDMATSF